jgi:hypothetical protein
VSEDLIVQGELAPTTLFGTNNPAEALAQMTEVATTLADVVRAQNLVVSIGQSEHVRVEGWTFLGSLLGVFPVVVWTHPVMRDDVQVGWEARVEARTRTGEVVGAAEAECLTDERTWKGRDDYARRSMAQTRAVSKALRHPLGFVMQLAGFHPTPVDEVPTVDMSDPDIPFGDDAGPQNMPPEPKLISAAQRTRLFTIAGNAGVDETVLRAIVLEATGQESTKTIPAGAVYDRIVAQVEAAGNPSESETA